MLNSISKPIVLTFLIFVSLNDCALLFLGPLEISGQNFQNKSDVTDGIQSKSLSRRESKEKQNTTSTAKLEFIDKDPFSKDLFSSSSVEAIKHNAKIHGTIKCDKNKDQDNIIATKDIFSRIEHLEKELTQEREKVESLTNELNFFKKMYDFPSVDYIDYECENLNPNKINFIDSSLDHFDLVNSKNDGNKNHDLNLSDNKFNGIYNLMLKKNASQLYSNGDEINKYLFSDIVNQIPKFAINNNKRCKNPKILNNMPVLNPSLQSYNGLSMQNPNFFLPCKYHNEKGDILRTLYPQFFPNDPNDVYDSISNAKRESGMSLLEPDQIYANNMKRLTAPYKIFPGRLNPDFRFSNIRNRRNGIRKSRRNLQGKRCLRRNNNSFKGNITESQASINDKLDQTKLSNINEIVNLTEDEPSTNVKSTENSDLSISEEMKNDNQISETIKSLLNKDDFSSVPDRQQDDSIKISNLELNDSGLNPDFEDRDVDSKASYFQSLNGARLVHSSHLNDFVDGKKISDIALEKCYDTYSPIDRLDLEDDKNTIEETEENNTIDVETPDEEFIKYIGPKINLKLPFNNGLKKNAASIEIYNEGKSDKIDTKNNFNDFKTMGGDEYKDNDNLVKHNRLAMNKISNGMHSRTKFGQIMEIENLPNESETINGDKVLKSSKQISKTLDDNDTFDGEIFENDENTQEEDIQL